MKFLKLFIALLIIFVISSKKKSQFVPLASYIIKNMKPFLEIPNSSHMDTLFFGSYFFNLLEIKLFCYTNSIRLASVKLDSTKKVWYLLLRVFWLLFPKFNFWKRDWVLAYVFTQTWDFPSISLFRKILTLFFLVWAWKPAQRWKCREHVRS